MQKGCVHAPLSKSLPLPGPGFRTGDRSAGRSTRAGRDELVRPARTDRLLEALPEGTRVVDLRAADHANLVEDPAYWLSLIHI